MVKGFGLVQAHPDEDDTGQSIFFVSPVPSQSDTRTPQSTVITQSYRVNYSVMQIITQSLSVMYSTSSIIEPCSIKSAANNCSVVIYDQWALSNQAVALSLRPEMGDPCKDIGIQSWVSLPESALSQ